MPGEIICRCDSCAARFKIDAKFAGRKAKCPKCTAVVLVPGTAAAGSTTSTSTVIPPAAPSAAAPPPSRTAPPKAAPPVAAPAVTASAAAPPPRRPAPAAQTPAAPAAESIPAPTIDPAASSPLAFTPTVSLSTGSSSTPSSKATKKKSSNLPIILAGVAIFALAIIGGGTAAVVYMLNSAGDALLAEIDKGQQAAQAGGTALEIAWAPGDRKGGSVTIDGTAYPLPATGSARFKLAAGKHELFLQRRGYEPIDATITVADGETETFAPEWKENEAAAAAATLAATPDSSSGPTRNTSGGRPATSFPIGGAAPTGPPGFDGYLQDIDAAAKQALAEGKYVLAVFGSTDSDELTQQLGRVFSSPAFKAYAQGSCVMVLIDFPRTNGGLNYVEDSARNMAVREEYSIRQVPTVTLFDAKLNAYFTTNDFGDTLRDPVASVTKWQQEKQKLDVVTSAIKPISTPEDFASVPAAIEYLKESELLPYYTKQVDAWYAAALNFDNTNEKGCLEVIFEPYLVTKLMGMRRNDSSDMRNVIDLTDPWLSRKFVDPDRAVKTHLMAAQLYGAIEDESKAESHLQRANTYKPTKSELVEALRQVNVMLSNRNVLATGTGFLISEAGYVMTNNHVIEGEGKIVVRIPGQADPVPAEVIAADEERDMALLKLTIPEGANLTPVAILDTQVGRGASVAAFGFPLGDQLGAGLKFTTGFVSAPPDGTDNNMILLDMRVNPGNSGGPLCDSAGNVVGMITAKTGGLGVDSYGYALPTSDLTKFLEANLPADAPKVEPAPAVDSAAWDKVDKRVSPGVLMILKLDE